MPSTFDNYVRSEFANPARSAFQNRVRGFYVAPPPVFSLKHITATVTCAVSAIPTFIGTIEANLNTIMAMMAFYGGISPDDTSQAFIYDFDAHPSFSIGSGTFLNGPNAWWFYGQQIQSFVQGSPPFGTGGQFYYKSLANTFGFDTKPNALAGTNATLKTLQWFWAYYPQYRPGTALPLYFQNNQSLTPPGPPSPPLARYIIDNLISVKPDADTNTPTTGSVFKVPMIPFSGNTTYRDSGPGWYNNPGFTGPTTNVFNPLYGGQQFIIDGDLESTDSGGAGGTGGSDGNDDGSL